MRADGVEFRRLAVDDDATEVGTFGAEVEDERQADRVVEMGVRQKNVERIGRHVLGDTIEGRAGVEDEARGGQHHARRLTAVVGVVASGTEQDELHYDVRSPAGRIAAIVIGDRSRDYGEGGLGRRIRGGKSAKITSVAPVIQPKIESQV